MAQDKEDKCRHIERALVEKNQGKALNSKYTDW